MSLDRRTVLSVQQPWAWLLTHGPRNPLLTTGPNPPAPWKDVENRTWHVGYRGTLWIHAGMKVDAKAYESLYHAFPNIPLPRLQDLPRRGIVGRVRLVEIVRDSPSVWAMTGCYHWKVTEPEETAFESMPGRQGLFHAGDVRRILPTPPTHPPTCECGDH